MDEEFSLKKKRKNDFRVELRMEKRVARNETDSLDAASCYVCVLYIFRRAS